MTTDKNFDYIKVIESEAVSLKDNIINRVKEEINSGGKLNKIKQEKIETCLTEALRGYAAELSLIEPRITDQFVDHVAKNLTGKVLPLFSKSKRSNHISSNLNPGIEWIIKNSLRNALKSSLESRLLENTDIEKGIFSCSESEIAVYGKILNDLSSNNQGKETSARFDELMGAVDTSKDIDQRVINVKQEHIKAPEPITISEIMDVYSLDIIDEEVNKISTKQVHKKGTNNPYMVVEETEAEKIIAEMVQTNTRMKEKTWLYVENHGPMPTPQEVQAIQPKAHKVHNIERGTDLPSKAKNLYLRPPLDAYLDDIKLPTFVDLEEPIEEIDVTIPENRDVIQELPLASKPTPDSIRSMAEEAIRSSGKTFSKRATEHLSKKLLQSIEKPSDNGKLPDLSKDIIKPLENILKTAPDKKVTKGSNWLNFLNFGAEAKLPTFGGVVVKSKLLPDHMLQEYKDGEITAKQLGTKVAGACYKQVTSLLSDQAAMIKFTISVVNEFEQKGKKAELGDFAKAFNEALLTHEKKASLAGTPNQPIGLSSSNIMPGITAERMKKIEEVNTSPNIHKQNQIDNKGNPAAVSPKPDGPKLSQGILEGISPQILEGMKLLKPSNNEAPPLPPKPNHLRPEVKNRG